ncbi:SCO3374 family protein [Streptomyces sp. NPDC001606]
MVGSAPTAHPCAHTVPPPRHPLDGGPESSSAPAGPEDARTRHWYENDLGWPTVPDAAKKPLRLLTGVRFDVLDVPAEAGRRALRHLAADSPVALRGDRTELLLAAGSAEELPGLLDWLEWGAIALDLRVLGAGEVMEAPLPPWVVTGAAVPGRGAPAQAAVGAAVWLRPPGPGREVEDSLPALPALSAVGREESVPDLVRLLDTVAAECHRIRLRRGCAGPSARERSRPAAFS